MPALYYSDNDFRNYSLYHHGILGQKWGKKQGPPYPLDASDHSSSEKKAGWRRSLGDYTIKSGTKVKRLTTKLNEDIGKERKYVTVKERDSEAYKNFYSGELSKQNKTPFVYQQEYYFTDKVRVAGLRSYNKAFNEVYKSHKDELGKYNKKEALKDFNKHLKDRDNTINQEFFDYLSSKGYDAVQDIFSRDELKSNSSLIMLNPEKNLAKGKTNIVLSNQSKNQQESAGGWYTTESAKGKKVKETVNNLAKVGGNTAGYTLGLAVGGATGGYIGRSLGGDVGKTVANNVIKLIGDKKVSTIDNNSTKELNSYLKGLSDNKLSQLRTVNEGYDKDLENLIDKEQMRRRNQ